MQASQEINVTKFFRKAASHERFLAGIFCALAIAIIVFLVLAGLGIINTSVMLGLCGFKVKYDLPCPACGMTTSAIAFFKGQILKAFYIQPAGALFCVIVTIICIISFFIAFSGKNLIYLDRFFTEIKTRYIIMSIIIIILAAWAVTLSRAI